MTEFLWKRLEQEKKKKEEEEEEEEEGKNFLFASFPLPSVY